MANLRCERASTGRLPATATSIPWWAKRLADATVVFVSSFQMPITFLCHRDVIVFASTMVG